ncbi:MAG TPA: (2Fe-2S)-binding protein [Chloroflexota bacterium]|nr:(2Fe-2S)-binding protein [Chloroflexota bacterium]
MAPDAVERWPGAVSGREVQAVDLNVNGRTYTVDAEPDTPLLYVLRNDLGLTGPKFGCGLSQCGACEVLMNGRATRSCVTPLSAAEGAEVITLEGLGTEDNPHPLQQAFIDEQAAQCGYCINGMIITAKAFLDSNPNADEAAIRQAMSRNLCRCATHLRILRAVSRYARGLQA